MTVSLVCTISIAAARAVRFDKSCCQFVQGGLGQPIGLGLDARRFGFARAAHAVIEVASGDEHAIVDAYARGVNAGLASLDSRSEPGNAPLALPGSLSVTISQVCRYEAPRRGSDHGTLRRATIMR